MPLIRDLLGGGARRSRSRSMPPLTSHRTAAGVTVTPERALQVAAVYSCIRVLAETGSMLPCSVVQRDGRARVPVSDHPVAPLVSHMANPELPSGEFWSQVLGWMLLRGNGVAYVERSAGGAPVGLWPIAWTSVEMLRQSDGRLVYKTTLANDEYAPIREPGGLVRSENMLHFRAFGTDTTEGLSPVGMARQSVATAYAATSYIGGFFSRDASPGGIVSVPGRLDDAQYDRLERQWKDLHEGFDQSHRLAILEAGASWAKTTLSPADAQFLEVYKLSRSDIAGIFGVPPHMIGDVERSTSWGSGIEQQSLGYVIYSLMPWLTRLERTTARLFGEDRSLQVKFDPKGLLRGDTTQRFAGYAQARQWGWMSVNDIRALEDEQPVDGGDAYLVPLNMAPAGDTAPPAQRSIAPPHTHTRSAESPGLDDLPGWIGRHFEALSEFFAGQGERVLATLGNDPGIGVDDILDRAREDADLARILVRLATALIQQVGGVAAGALGQAATFDVAVVLELIGASSAATAANINTTTAGRLAEAMGATDVATEVGAMFDKMTAARARQLAQARVLWGAAVGAHEGAKQAGAKTKTWRVTSQSPRPSHKAAHGDTVDIADEFKVGTHRGRWPHDHTLGVDEIAGCTCRLVFNL